MKKRVISILAVVFLLTALLPAAHAATYSSPGSVQAGVELYYLAATVPEGSEVSAVEETMPAGVGLELEKNAKDEGKLDVYLSGVPVQAGRFDCIIRFVSGELISPISFPLTVLPAAPQVSAGPAVNCYLNDPVTVSVSASASDGGTLRYQWYYNAALNTTTGTPIDGATDPVYYPDTSREGTVYYYCVVTNEGGGMTNAVTSDIIPVTVSAMAISSITVETLPVKTVYTEGDALDVTGLSIRARYSNNASVVVTEGFDVSPRRLETAGVQNIEIRYEGLVCTFQVTVEPPEEVIEGIGVLTLPDKRSYSVGDTLDVTGLSIRAYTNLGMRDVTAEELECSPTVFEKAGEQTVTVTYGGKSCTFTLTVQEEEKPLRLILGSLPDKTQYTVGETLDTEGLTVLLITNRNNQQEIRDGFTCSPTQLDSTGTRQITVSYEGLSCTFNVTVSALAATPSPLPQTTPTPAPAPTFAPLPSAVPTPHIVEHQSHETNGGNTLFVVVIFLAILALMGIGITVYIMNRGGPEEIRRELAELMARIKGRPQAEPETPPEPQEPLDFQLPPEPMDFQLPPEPQEPPEPQDTYIPQHLYDPGDREK